MVFLQFFKIEKMESLFIEIDTSHIGNEFIYFSYFENGVMDAGVVKGRYRGQKLLKSISFLIKLILQLKIQIIILITIVL